MKTEAPELTLVDERYETPANLDAQHVPAAASTIRLPAGWQATRGYRTRLLAQFERGRGDRFTAAVPILFLLFERGAESLEVQIADTAGGPARDYAAAVLAEGTAIPVPLGHGFAKGPTAVVDTGSRLIRATYDDGADGQALSADEARARMRELQSRAEQLLFELG